MSSKNIYHRIITDYLCVVLIHVPRLNLLSSPEVRQPGKAPNYSVNWTTSLSDFENPNTKDLKEDEQLEIVDAMKGKEQVGCS